ncbi:hypothetical protein B0W44_15695 [Novibacillus thermophilus]|uniref:Uncharacterized protein n=1 Tax=Novibacillus thermophilus TaxID=1471761 RepID=A0A1U9KAE4_9BACL|nr:hypothetical protein B0W44_15695 [Novibacillus thermophilus]
MSLKKIQQEPLKYLIVWILLHAVVLTGFTFFIMTTVATPILYLTAVLVPVLYVFVVFFRLVIQWISILVYFRKNRYNLL